MSDKPLKMGELFAGYGGLGSLGIGSVLPVEPAWFCEFDKAPSAILAHHWPDVPNLGDITAVDWSTVEPVDVLTGGFPCQDVSHAGRRAGLIRDGEGRTRSGLWGHMLRAIDQLRPRLVVAENVRGLLSATADSDVEPCPWCLGDANGEPDMRALGAVLADLADVGYDAWWVGLPASGVGAPHGRFRVFIFATPADSQGDKQREPFVGMGERAKPRRSDPSAGLTLLPTPAVNDMGEGKTVEHWDAWTATMQAKHGNGNGHGKSLAIEAQRLLPTPSADFRDRSEATGRAKLDETRDFMDLGSVAATDRWGDYAAAIARWEAALGRPAPAPTEPGPKGNPCLSPAFVEWMMGLPAGHVTDQAAGLTRNEQLKALGNGVVPQQAAEATSWWLAQVEAVTA